MMLRFGVSYESLIYRLHNLRVINAEGRDRLARLGWTGLLQQMADNDLREQLIAARSVSVPYSAPVHLLMRAFDGYKQGIISVRPLADLLREDPDRMMEALRIAAEEDPDRNYAPNADEGSNEALYEADPL
jgi:hypothetical protein